MTFHPAAPPHEPRTHTNTHTHTLLLRKTPSLLIFFVLYVPCSGSTLWFLLWCSFRHSAVLSWKQSYEIKSPPWTILWFRILGIFSVENIKRLCVFMFQTWDNSQLLRRVLWISAELTIVSSLKHKNTQPLYIFNRVRVLHLDRLKEGTWLHSFGNNNSSYISKKVPKSEAHVSKFDWNDLSPIFWP